jgi:hypothetical protein
MENEMKMVATAPMGVTAGFQSAEGFALLQRMANMFVGSTLVPEQFRGEKNFGNCVIALNMAQRLGADPLMVMQNLYVVYGTPSWSSKFMIAMFNQCGRYESIRYEETGTKGTDTQGIIAWAKEKSTGEILKGPEITIKTAKDEGWFAKSGSKWKTMPDQMLRYRAAAWFIRTTAPELSMGLQTVDEVTDTIDVTPRGVMSPLTEELRRNANTEALVPQLKSAQNVPSPETMAQMQTIESTADLQEEVRAITSAPRRTGPPTVEATPSSAAPVSDVYDGMDF